jgi:hypothetical protein
MSEYVGKHHRLATGEKPYPKVTDNDDVDPPAQDGYKRQTHLCESDTGCKAGTEGETINRSPGA